MLFHILSLLLNLLFSLCRCVPYLSVCPYFLLPVTSFQIFYIYLQETDDWSICLSIFLSFCLSVVLSLCPSVCLFCFLCPLCPSYMTFCLSVYLSFYMSFCLSVRLSVCLSVFLSSSNVLFYFFSVGYRL